MAVEILILLAVAVVLVIAAFFAWFLAPRSEDRRVPDDFLLKQTREKFLALLNEAEAEARKESVRKFEEGEAAMKIASLMPASTLVEVELKRRAIEQAKVLLQKPNSNESWYRLNRTKQTCYHEERRTIFERGRVIVQNLEIPDHSNKKYGYGPDQQGGTYCTIPSSKRERRVVNFEGEYFLLEVRYPALYEDIPDSLGRSGTFEPTGKFGPAEVNFVTDSLAQLNKAELYAIKSDQESLGRVD